MPDTAGLPVSAGSSRSDGAYPHTGFHDRSPPTSVSNQPDSEHPGDADLRARLARAEQSIREDGHHALASELTLGLLHKLNNLMTGVYFNLEGAEAALDQAHPAAALVREITRSIQQAQTLVRRTADLNLAPEAEPSYFDISALIQESWDLVKIILPKSTVAELKVPAEPLYVKVSSEEFCEALLQLASVTRAAYRSGESHVSVEVQPIDGLDLSGFRPAPAAPEGGVAVLYRDDVLEGADPGNMSLFQAFNEEGGGVGCRLFRARELIRKQNGSLAARTVSGRKEFIIVLPGVS